MTAFAVPHRCGGDEIRIHFMGGSHRRRRRRHGGPYAFGRRAGRGDIRAAILVLLAEEPMHGYQIIQELTERTGGVWRPSPGSVYPTLQQLQDEELVREAPSESGKRVYELTEAGREHAAGQTAPWGEVTGESTDALVALHDLVHQVMAATRQVAHAGTAAQLESAQAILRDARRALYRLLAEDAPDADEPAGE
jgi:DNA-binding PadR family transcriptional regulator